MTKKSLIAIALAVAVLVPSARAEDEMEVKIARSSYKQCISDRNESWKKTYTQGETENFCGCWAVGLHERLGDKEQIPSVTAAAAKEVDSYCARKYLNLPDVTTIRKKKW